MLMRYVITMPLDVFSMLLAHFAAAAASPLPYITTTGYTLRTRVFAAIFRCPLTLPPC